MEITMLGIDLAKTVFQLHGVDKNGKVLLRKTLKRSELIEFMANLPITKVAMEACGSSNFWGRTLSQLGHQVFLIAAQYVKPFKKTKQKNDFVDAEAIVEAALRPSMRFVAIKNLHQQDIQSLHRVRQQLIDMKTQMVNQVRGLLAEYGLIIDEGFSKFNQQLPEILETADNGLTTVMRGLAADLHSKIIDISDCQTEVERKLKHLLKDNDDYQRLLDIPGVGPYGASMFLASVGEPTSFKNGRHVAAWVGLVPRQLSSGGKERLVGITKAGDHHLRSMLIHGARSLILATIKKKNKDPLSHWILKLYETKGWNRTAVAVANKNVRIMWHIYKNKDTYEAA